MACGFAGVFDHENSDTEPYAYSPDEVGASPVRARISRSEVNSLILKLKHDGHEYNREWCDEDESITITRVHGSMAMMFNTGEIDLSIIQVVFSKIHVLLHNYT